MPLDTTYFILVLPAVLFAFFCQFRVSYVFKRYANIPTRRGITGREVARRVCSMGEASYVTIEATSGKMTDHFDPRSNVIRLSQTVYDNTSVAAAGVAAHEAGHASQYARGYGPIRLRSAIIPVTQITSNLAMPLVIAGLFLNFGILINIGILFFSLAFFFQVITLPIEFNASRRAMAYLRSGGILDEDELRGARKVLSAAAMTYVAAMAVSLVQLLRLLMIARRR